jgi:hypothetical protein
MDMPYFNRQSPYDVCGRVIRIVLAQCSSDRRQKKGAEFVTAPVRLPWRSRFVCIGSIIAFNHNIAGDGGAQ